MEGGQAGTPGIFVTNEAFRIDPTIVAAVIAVPLLITVTIVTVVLERRRTGHGKKH